MDLDKDPILSSVCVCLCVFVDMSICTVVFFYMHRSNILTWYVWRTTSARGNALWIHRPRLLQVRTGNKVQFQYDFCMVLSWKWIFSQLGHFRGSRAISWLEEKHFVARGVSGFSFGFNMVCTYFNARTCQLLLWTSRNLLQGFYHQMVNPGARDSNLLPKQPLWKTFCCHEMH